MRIGGGTTYIAVDDTDSPEGMCTTFVMREILRKLVVDGEWNLIGYPRLVRLNPNIPWKTRGNGALAARIGRGRGRTTHIGRIAGSAVVMHSATGPEPGGMEWERDAEGVARAMLGVVEELAPAKRGGKPGPAVLVCRGKPPPSLYWRALREVLRVGDAMQALRSDSVEFYDGNGRGLIGAAAALAWRPQGRSYEVLAWRERARWGTPRRIEPESVFEMAGRFRHTFQNLDAKRNRILITPRSPCPILFGIRGWSAEGLLDAAATIRGERPESLLVFETNQGTDEHLVNKCVAEIGRWESVRVRGTVAAAPRAIPGGHVLFPLSDGAGRIECAAYEPTKEFRNVVRLLRAGDAVEAMGAVGDHPHTVNLEKLRVLRLASAFAPGPNPLCRRCGARLHSAGRNAGFRCRRCGWKTIRKPLRRVVRELRRGLYQVPPCARRHLARPEF